MTNLTPHYSLWAHAIIGTVNKLPLIIPENENQIYRLLQECLNNQQLKVEIINGFREHIHFLFRYSSNICLSQVIEEALIECRFLINKDIYPAGSFDWHDNYAIFSVSYSQIAKVSEYIKNQKNIHIHKSFQKEWNEFIEVHDI